MPLIAVIMQKICTYGEDRSIRFPDNSARKSTIKYKEKKIGKI